MDYLDFITNKQRKTRPLGFEVEGDINDCLFDWQREAVRWALKRGRAALFQECGLGKTIQQLAWADEVVKHTGKPVILHCPVGVRAQTLREAEKFNINSDVAIANTSDDICPGINLVNYEKLHHFDTSVFAGVVLDESSILKNYTGKTKRLLIDSYAETPYRLACTATAAPNDHMELGNHAEFLGVMPSNEMLSRWFINDTMKAGGYRLKRHAEDDFWRWVASWAVCASSPSDLGGSDDGYDLPELQIKRHVVSVEPTNAPDGMLFNTSGLSATNIHEEKRLTCEARCRKAAELVNHRDDFSLIWCDTNYEADMLREMVEGAHEVRGSHSEKSKEEILQAFSLGNVKRLITKPSVAGFGLNWQHCSHQVFAGLSYSFEAYYQAIRRSWRFGQHRPVEVDIVLSDSESAVESAVARKENDHRVMQSGMAKAMRSATNRDVSADLIRERYAKRKTITLPDFMKKESANAY